MLDDQAGFQADLRRQDVERLGRRSGLLESRERRHRRAEHADNAVKENTFIIWRGGEPKDFELKVQFKMNATNSGIQIRSVHLPPAPRWRPRVQGKWVMKGYQADIDFENQFTGQIYEERGRGFLAMRGQAVYVPDGDGAKPRVIGNLQQTADELKAIIKQNDWNQVHLIARGNTIVQILNGAVTSIVVDDDTKDRALGGLIGFQMHVGEPMRVEFRNIWLKKLLSRPIARRRGKRCRSPKKLHVVAGLQPRGTRRGSS